jgi:hypothetical protein
MKKIITLIFVPMLFLAACKKSIDLNPLSNVATSNYYKTGIEIQQALTGCYSGLKAPLVDEWKMTELRSDNSIMGNAGSTSVPNRELSDLDLFIPSTTLNSINNYWTNVYFNIRNINLILKSLSINYDEVTGVLKSDSTSVIITTQQRKELSAEATFLRAYHYFNLVRLYGGVFLIHKPITPDDAISINRSTVADIYKFIIADLEYAAANGVSLNYPTIASQNFGANLGKVNSWTAKALLAKVYLTLNRKSDAIPLLTEVINNSGYGLLTGSTTSYADVFSTTNEVNKEVMFAVRYKAGGLGLGSPWPNSFAPELSGTAVVNGDGRGFNNGTTELETLGYSTADLRKPLNLAIWSSGNNRRLYPKKHISQVLSLDDGENDWIVLRFADVLFMLAEAQGNIPSSLAIINQTRTRAGLTALSATSVATTAQFETELAKESRLEFAFENKRWFDMLRYSITMPSQDAVTTIKNHFSVMYAGHYGKYPAPAATLLEIQNYVNTNRLLLPIPQREIDNNTKILILQNPGY